MKITPALRAQMESDIAICESYAEINGSERVYSELVARYVVLDPAFTKGLSTNGKIAAIDSEFDFRPELLAIAAKLKMYLLINDVDDNETPRLQMQVKEFVTRGEKIGREEYHPAENGFAISYVSGPQYDMWMSEINIFNERYLKNHPLHGSIHTTFFHRNTKPSAYDDMMGYLRALESDNEYWKDSEPKEKAMAIRSRKTIDQMLAEDIELCEQYLDNPSDEQAGIKLYVKITSRYDSVIDGLGNGLYQYYRDEHFYDPEISGETLLHNMQMLHGKMVSYQATNFPPPSSHMGGQRPKMLYDVFISHANADKIEYVDQLKESIDKLRIKVFYDKDSLEWGDNWKTKILEGVGQAEFAIIVISENFFGREWTEKELREFLSRQNTNGQKIILPILHNITTAQLKEEYPAVADIQALNSADYSCDEIALKFAGQLIKRLKS